MPTDIALFSFPNAALDVEVSNNSSSGRIARPGPYVPPDTPEEPDGNTTGGGNGDARVVLTANRTSGVTPAGFQIRATATGFDTARPYNDLRYRWTFSDPGTWRRLRDDMPWGTGKNTAYGPWTAHTYAPTAAEFGGAESITRTITCDVTDGTTTVSTSLDITLINPDFFFAGTATICVSQSGNFAGAPAGCQTFTDIQAARDEFYQRGVKRRILLRCGETFNLAGGNAFDCNHVQLGHFGDPADGYPLLTPAGIEVTHRHEGDFTVWGLDLLGTYDPSLANFISQAKGIEISGKYTDRFTTIHDCSASGFSICIAPAGNRYNTMVSDTYCTNWYDFAFFQSNVGWASLVACSFVQNPLTKNYDGKYDTPYPCHGPMRMSRLVAGPIILRNVDAASFNDWSMNPGSTYTVQPPCRLNNGGDSSIPELCVTQLRSIGSVLGLPATNTYSDTFPVKAVFDKVYHHRWGQGGIMSTCDFGGATLKNLILVNGNVPWGGNRVFAVEPGYAGGALFAASWEEYLSTDYPIEWIGITVVKLQGLDQIGEKPSNYNPTWLVENSRFPSLPPWGAKTFDPAAVSTHNVLFHVPAWDEAQPIDTSSLFTPYALGKREGELPLDTTYALAPSDAPNCRPLQTIPANSGEKLPLDDFYGTLRGANPSKGAVEPGSGL